MWEQLRTNSLVPNLIAKTIRLIEMGKVSIPVMWHAYPSFMKIRRRHVFGKKLWWKKFESSTSTTIAHMVQYIKILIGLKNHHHHRKNLKKMFLLCSCCMKMNVFFIGLSAVQFGGFECCNFHLTIFLHLLGIKFSES